MKKIIERVLKVVNIIVNTFFGIMAIMNGGSYITNGYVYSDELVRVFSIVIMIALVNLIHAWIQKAIRDF